MWFYLLEYKQQCDNEQMWNQELLLSLMQKEGRMFQTYYESWQG